MILVDEMNTCFPQIASHRWEGELHDELEPPDAVRIPVVHIDGEECAYEPLYFPDGTILFIPLDPEKKRGRLRWVKGKIPND